MDKSTTVLFDDVNQDPNAISDLVYAEFCKFLEQRCGIVLGKGRQYLVQSRLGKLMTVYQYRTMDLFIKSLMEDKSIDMLDKVIDAMTTNETSWFRDIYPFEVLANYLLPKMGHNGAFVRIWSCACSTGQEPYSIAMTALEQMFKIGGIPSTHVAVTASDISDTVLSIAAKGIYDSLSMSRGLSEERKNLFFRKIQSDDSPRLYQICGNVRCMVHFRKVNLLDEFSWVGRFEIIFCRNVLIYFSEDVKNRILQQFYNMLVPGGYLVLGSTEFIPRYSKGFKMVHIRPCIVFRRE